MYSILLLSQQNNYRKARRSAADLDSNFNLNVNISSYRRTLTRHQPRVLDFLRWYINNKTITTFKISTISKAVGCSERTVQRTISKFKEDGLFTRKRYYSRAPWIFVWNKSFKFECHPIINTISFSTHNPLKKVEFGSRPWQRPPLSPVFLKTKQDSRKLIRSSIVKIERQPTISDNTCLKREKVMLSPTLERIKARFNLDADDVEVCSAYPESILTKAELKTQGAGVRNQSSYFMAACKGILSEPAAKRRSAGYENKEEKKVATSGERLAQQALEDRPAHSNLSVCEHIRGISAKIQTIQYLYQCGYRGSPEGKEKWEQDYRDELQFWTKQLDKLNHNPFQSL